MKRWTNLITFSQTHQEKKGPNKLEIRKEKLQLTSRNTVIGDYYEQVYDYKLEKLEEMGKFLEACYLLRLSQEEIENTNRPILVMKLNQ